MKPRETGGNVPKAKPKAKPIATRRTYVAPKVKVPKPEVAVQKPKVVPPAPEVAKTKPVRKGPKTVKPEVTRPISRKTQQKIDTHTMLVNRAYKIKKANDAENKAEGHYIKLGGLTYHPEAHIKPAMQALNVVSTPLHAVAGAANRAAGRDFKGLTPGQLLKGAKEGIKKKTTYSDVLKTSGVQNKAVRGVVGFTGDVLLDPTTYVTFGTTSLAKEAASKAGARVAEKALKQGMTHDVASRLAKQAAKKAAKDAEGKTIQRAVTVGVGKRKLKVAPLAAKRKAKEGSLASDIGEAFSPRYVHPAATEEAHKTLKAAQLEERGRSAAGVRKSVERARALSKSLSKSEQKQVIDAIEAGKLKGLPDHLRPTAQRIRDDFRHMARVERQSGLLTRELKDYFPHVRNQDITKQGGKIVRPGNPAVLGSSKARGIDKSIAELRSEVPHLFSEDLPVIYAKRGAASAEAVARTHTISEVAKTGRKLTPEAQWNTATEAIYKVTPTRLIKLEKDDKIQAAEIDKAAHGLVPGQYVILNKHTADKIAERVPQVKGPFVRRYDKAQGLLKTALTIPRPAYHVRNLIGDSWNAYLGQSFPSLVRNFWHSARIERGVYRAHQNDASLALNPEHIARDAGVVIRGRKVSYDDLAKRARQAGVIDSGFYGRDIVDLVGQSRKISGHRAIEPMRRLGQYRENLVRLNTWKHGLDMGMTDREAAEFATDLHFDYGNLSDTERKLRRVFPFYTFTARNTPLQARSLVTKPGKYANFEKLREEAAKASGLPVGEQNDYQQNLREYEQLGIPIPVPGVKLPVSPGKESPALAYFGLPVTDLNRLTPNFKEQIQLVGSMATGLKSPLELVFNYSLFFRDKIDNGQKVAAPNWVGKLPPGWKKKLGVVYATDKVSGKKVWRWSPSVDYAMKQLPQISFILDQTTSGANRRGQGRGPKLAASLGAKVQPYDPKRKKLDDLYSQQEKLKNEARYTDPGSPERKRVNAQMRTVTHQIAQTKKALGYAITGEEKKAKKKPANPLDAIQSGGNPLDKVGGSKNPLDQF